MLPHLHGNKTSYLSLVKTQDFARFVFGEIPSAMLDNLGSKLVQQVSLIVVGDVVEIDQTADDVVF